MASAPVVGDQQQIANAPAGAQAPQELGTGWDAERIERKNPWDLGQPVGISGKSQRKD